MIVVGAGPIGLACGVEASRRGVKAVILEKGCLTESVFRFPPHLVFFSTPELLELGGVPFVTAGPRPTRVEVLEYYRRIAGFFRLDVRTFDAVVEVQSDGDSEFQVRTASGRTYLSRFVVMATGCYERPNLLGIPGEDLPKVSHYFREPHPFHRRKVVVVGGQNSAVEASLDLWRHGADVTLIHRGASLGQMVKYWIRPDLENRIKERAIRALFNARVERIEKDHVVVRMEDGEATRLENDFVFLMTGYHADLEFLADIGIVFDPDDQKPIHDPATMETNLPGVYVAGVLAGGKENNRLFIENTRFHAKLILQDIERKIEMGSSYTI